MLAFGCFVVFPGSRACGSNRTNRQYRLDCVFTPVEVLIDARDARVSNFDHRSHFYFAAISYPCHDRHRQKRHLESEGGVRGHARMGIYDLRKKVPFTGWPGSTLHMDVTVIYEGYDGDGNVVEGAPSWIILADSPRWSHAP